MQAKVTLSTLFKKKQAGEKITMLTAYDYSFAKLIDSTEVDIILVGDSLGMVMLGYKDTLPVTMDEIVHHSKAVSRAVTRAFVVGDLPFLSYQASLEEGIKNAGRLLKEGGTQGVKLEGGRQILPLIQALVGTGIPVMGHLGLTPQSYHQLGGYRVQGRSEASARRIFEDALQLEEAGVFSLILECVPWQLAKLISSTLSIPVIGIGAGPHCDGQVLVLHDMLGLNPQYSPKHSKIFVNISHESSKGINQFIGEVKAGTFPTLDHSFTIDESLINALKGLSSENGNM